jgi:hypothetical protein
MPNETAKLAGSSGTGVATSAKMAAANGVPNQKWQICQNGKTSLQFRYLQVGRLTSRYYFLE